MLTKLKTYFLTLFIFIVLDCLWFGLFAEAFYREQLSHIGASEINFLAVGLFYLLYIGGIVHFIIKPALITKNLIQTAKQSAVFGLIIYGTHHLTNTAMLNNWPIKFSIIDITWGIFITMLTAVISVRLQRAK